MADIFDTLPDTSAGDIFDQIAPDNAQPTQQRPSVLASLLRSVMGSSGIEQMNTASYLQDKMPQPMPNETMQQYQQRVNQVAQPREQQIASKGSLAQLELPIGVGLAGAGASAPLQTAKMVGKFAGLDALTNLIGLNPQNLPDNLPPEVKDVAEIAKVGIEGGLASQNLSKMTGLDQLLTPGFRYFNRIKSRLNPEDIPNLNVSSLQRINNLANLSRSSANEDISNISKDISNIKQVNKDELTSLMRQTKEFKNKYSQAIDESRAVLKDNLKNLSLDLQKAAETGAVAFQERLPEFFSNNSEAYGTRLDEISDALSNKNQGITRQDVFDLINNTQKDMNEALIPEGSATQAIDLLKQKYQPQMISKLSKFNSQATGEKAGTLESNAKEIINFKELLQDLRNVKSTISSQAKSGGRFSQEDLAVKFLDNNLGNYVKDFSPEFAQLQKDYAPVINVMKESNKIFKPYKGELNTKTGTEFLKRAAMGKLEAGEQRTLEAVQKGNQFSQGVGNVSDPVLEIGQKIKEEVSKSPMDRLRKSMNDELIKLENKKNQLKDLTNSTVIQKRGEIEARQKILQNRLESLNLRRTRAIQLLANKKAAERVRNALLIGGSVIGVPLAGKKIVDTISHVKF